MPEQRPQILLPSVGGVQAAGLGDLAVLERTQIALIFTLLESDINFDGLAISTDWLDPSQAGESAALRLARMVDDAITRDYPPDMLATIRIDGLAPACDAVRWLRALRLRSHIRPSKLTQMALVKS